MVSQARFCSSFLLLAVLADNIHILIPPWMSIKAPRLPQPSPLLLLAHWPFTNLIIYTQFGFFSLSFLPANVSNVEMDIVNHAVECAPGNLSPSKAKWQMKRKIPKDFAMWNTEGKIRMHCWSCGVAHSFPSCREAFFTISGAGLLTSYSIKHPSRRLIP